MNKLSEISIEVEQDLYDEVSVLCRNAGTSVEALTAAFFEFCIIPENLPSLKVFLEKEKAASAEKPAEKTGIHGKLERAKEEMKAGDVLGKPQGKTRDTAMVM